MKVVIFLGNGFDINLGLKTRYTDFYKVFLAKNQASWNVFQGDNQQVHRELVEMIRENMNLPHWADLEILLGKSIKTFSSIDHLQKEKAYLEQSLNDYLQIEQQHLHIQTERASDIRELLNHMILRFFREFDWSQDIQSNDSENIEVQFITFNYTDTIQKIVLCINSIDSSDHFKYSDPLYIHGRINEIIILGVDNEEQYWNTLSGVRNTAYRSSEITFDRKDLNSVMLKPEMNFSLRNRELSQIEYSIKEADRILIFGSSIGETDGVWWKKIAKWLTQGDGKYRHKLGILFRMNTFVSASATDQMRIIKIEEKFENLARKSSNKNESPKRLFITVKKCEDWMFSFDKSMIDCQ